MDRTFQPSTFRGENAVVSFREWHPVTSCRNNSPWLLATLKQSMVTKKSPKNTNSPVNSGESEVRFTIYSMDPHKKKQNCASVSVCKIPNIKTHTRNWCGRIFSADSHHYLSKRVGVPPVTIIAAIIWGLVPSVRAATASKRCWISMPVQ